MLTTCFLLVLVGPMGCRLILESCNEYCRSRGISADNLEGVLKAVIRAEVWSSRSDVLRKIGGFGGVDLQVGAEFQDLNIVSFRHHDKE